MKTNGEFKWDLEKPLAIFDIEATGINSRTDRIVELAIVRLEPDRTRSTSVFRINPEMPIPAAATDIHGITNADVADCPKFKDLAQKVLAAFDNCDIGGYNVIHFDIPMLQEEFLRTGTAFPMDGRRVIDAQRIFHKREPRDLTAALKFYCGEMHLNAHGAESDTLATVRVFEGEFQRYKDLPRNMDELDSYCNPKDPAWVDKTGRLRWLDGQIVLNFGKKKDTSLKMLVENDPGFVRWLLRSDFPRDMQEIVKNALEGKWPTPPTV